MDLKEQILVALGLNKAEEELKLEWQAKSEDGTIFVSTAEELESGVDFSVLTEDGTTIPAPIGTYRLESGVSVRISEEGVVAEVIESESEEVDTVEEEELAKEDEDNYEEEADVADWSGMEKRIENLEIAVAKLKEAKEGGDDEVEEMAEEVSEPRSTSPKTITTKEVVEFSAEEVEAIKAENEKLKTELAASPADSPINTNKFSSERTALSTKEYKKLSKQERFLYNLNK
jgi:hypothetical protein